MNRTDLALLTISQAIWLKGWFLPRKEVIHPQLPLRIPCYDLTPIISPTLDQHKCRASGVGDFRGLTGGVYKTRERIHRGVLTHGY